MMFKAVCFAFLQEISKKFRSMFEKSRIENAIAYDAHLKIFGRVLENEMAIYGNTDSVNTNLEEMRNKIQKTKEIMVHNIEMVINRGDMIDELLGKAEVIKNDSKIFSSMAKKVKIKMWWKNMMVWIIGGVILIILIWLIFSFACGFDFGFSFYITFIFYLNPFFH